VDAEAAGSQGLAEETDLPGAPGEAVEQEHRPAARSARGGQGEGGRLRLVEHQEERSSDGREPVNPPRDSCYGGTMSEGTKPPEIQLQIQLDDDVANGRYANMALVNHSETEFTLDFIYVQPQQPRAKVLSRIITNPKHMKRLLSAIQDNLSKFEAKFGPIDSTDPGTPVH
jgi:hypothetical protein